MAEEWLLSIKDKHLPDDTLEIISPAGFRLDLRWKVESILFVAVLAQEALPDVLVSDGSRFNVVGNELILVSTDVWTNKGFDHGDVIAKCNELAQIIARFLASHE